MAQDQDLLNGLDLSTQQSVTGVQLNQLVAAGQVASNKGLMIVQAGAPDMVSNPRWETIGYGWALERTRAYL